MRGWKNKVFPEPLGPYANARMGSCEHISLFGLLASSNIIVRTRLDLKHHRISAFVTHLIVNVGTA